MEKTIIIRGRHDQILFFDDEDRKTFRWACSLLLSHLKNDLRTHERCGRAVHIDFSEDTATVRVEEIALYDGIGPMLYPESVEPCEQPDPELVQF